MYINKKRNIYLKNVDEALFSIFQNTVLMLHIVL